MRAIWWLIFLLPVAVGGFFVWIVATGLVTFLIGAGLAVEQLHKRLESKR